MLGEEQWIWLEKIFKNSKETYIFIGSGTQILPIDRILTEAWYEKSRIRLFELIGKYKKSGVIFMSGDIHTGQIIRTPCELPSK
jgi:alkaline phosphatase D